MIEVESESVEEMIDNGRRGVSLRQREAKGEQREVEREAEGEAERQEGAGGVPFVEITPSSVPAHVYMPMSTRVARVLSTLLTMPMVSIPGAAALATSTASSTSCVSPLLVHAMRMSLSERDRGSVDVRSWWCGEVVRW